MNKELLGVAERLRKRFVGLDIRTDQCDIIRITMKGITIGVEYQSGEYRAMVISLDTASDFETTLLKTIANRSLAELEPALTAEVCARIGQ